MHVLACASRYVTVTTRRMNGSMAAIPLYHAHARPSRKRAPETKPKKVINRSEKTRFYQGLVT